MELCEAVTKGDLGLVQHLIQKGSDINQRDEDGFTPVNISVGQDYMEITEELVAKGADIHIRCNKGTTPLHWAAHYGFLASAQFLLNKGSGINKICNEGFTPLIVASQRGHLELVKEFIKCSPKVNIRDNEGRTALHKAASDGREDIVRILIEQGQADISIRDNKGDSAAILAAQKGHTEVMKYLIQIERDKGSGSLSHRGGIDPDILIRAVKKGRMKTVRVLVDMGADAAQIDPLTGLKLEKIAQEKGHWEMASWLQKRTNRIIDDNSQSSTVTQPELESCKRCYGETDLAEIQRPKEITCMKESKIDDCAIDLHFQDDEGWSHLHWMVKKNNIKGLEILLNRGTFPMIKSHLGITPLGLAKELGHSEAASTLEKHLRKFENYEIKSSLDQCHYYNVLLHLICDFIRISGRFESDDAKAEQEMQKLQKKASWLLSLGLPLEKPLTAGVFDIPALALSISHNCRPILTLLLAASAPLHITHHGLDMIQTAWLTPGVTTWIAVTVTRAIINKLNIEISHQIKEEHSDLILALNNFVEQLDSQSPWTAVINREPENLNILLSEACESGATLSAWLLNRAGASPFYQRENDGKTSLHIALEGNHFETAKALLYDMGANAFLADHNGCLPIDLIPQEMKDDVIKVLQMKEYGILDEFQQREINICGKRSIRSVILLLMTLSMTFKKFSYNQNWNDEWKDFFMNLLCVLHSSDNEDKQSEDWILDLQKKLGESCLQISSNQEDIDEFLDGLDREYSIETESYNILVRLIESLMKVFWNSKQDYYDLISKHTKHVTESEVNDVINISSKMCCVSKLPFFLYLLVNQAQVDPSSIVDPITKAKALHYAAVYDNMSISAYLLQNGALKSETDIYGCTASHLAYMHGHNALGCFLDDGLKHKTSNGLKPIDMWHAHKKYLSFYYTNPDELKEVNLKGSEKGHDLVKLHLEALKVRCLEKGIEDSAISAKVDYSKGESFAIQCAVKEFIGQLITKISDNDSRFEADIEYVGSSEDDSRLITPDEYDCNIIFRNFSFYPEGGCTMKMERSPKEETHLATLTVSTERQDLEPLLREGNLICDFSHLIKKCLPNIDIQDSRLNLTLPSVKQTLVGAALSFAWYGEEFPLLLIDIDLVPSIKGPWPQELEKPPLSTSNKEIYVNPYGMSGWRFSFAQEENAVMKAISDYEKQAFLACKLVLASLKAEGWMPPQVKDRYKYWIGRKLKIPLPKGFMLKNAFLFEKEEITDPAEWQKDKIPERMISIFKRMCSLTGDKKVVGIGKVPAYFGQSTQDQCIGHGAPEIVAFLQEWFKLP